MTDLMPHAWCLRWRPEILVPMITGDALLFIAYTIISIYLIGLLRLPFGPVTVKMKPFLYLFGLFIMACGLTHLMNIITLYYPIYWLSTPITFFAGIVSIGTAGIVVLKRGMLRALFQIGYKE